ncbi:hypothetical protein TNCV_4229351 [Trichonephila clavipes]|nr:hypothetical protein TNCV_4229351 [Trichonephila clavipes]
MFSLSVCDQVRFKTRKGTVFTSLPVYVEFGKITKGDKNSKYVNSSDWQKLNSGDWDSNQKKRDVDNLVFRTSDSRSEGLDSMLDATKYLSSIHGYVLSKSVGLKVLWEVAVKTTGAGGWGIFPSPPVLCLNCGGGDMWCHHLSCRSPSFLRLWQLIFLPDGKETTSTYY